MSTTAAQPHWRTPAVVLVCGGIIITLAMGIRHGFGLHFGRETFALAMAVQNLTWGATQPFAGMLADKYGTGRVAASGALLYAVGLACMSYASTPTTLILSAGLLVGIGETLEETIDTISAIADLHRRFGHIQEVIVQNFRAHAGTRSATAEEPSAEHFLRVIALARCLLPAEISLQAPPNLLPCSLGDLVAAGINDLGGISPMTPDYINPGHAWPHLGRLEVELGAMGRQLRARLPVYPRFINDTWLDEPVRSAIGRADTERWASGPVALQDQP